MRSLDPFYFAPQRKLDGGWLLFKSSPSPPPAPDYAGAATAQGAANVEAARVQSRLSNPNIISPYGSRTVEYGPNDQSTVTENLSPAGQALLTQENATKYGLGELANKGISQVQGAIGKPFDPSAAPGQVSSLDRGYFQGAQAGGPIQGQLNPQDFDREQVINSLYGQQTSRLDPQWQQREEATRTQLANQGLAPGGEAYTNAMRDQNFAKNDAYNSAINSAISNATGQQQAQFGMSQGAGQFANQAQAQGYGQGLAGSQANNAAEQARLSQQQAAGQFQNQARQQSIQEAAYARGLPLNEVTALMSGSQIQGPQFQPFGGSSVAPAPVFNAAQQQGQYDMGLFNQQTASSNAQTQGLMQAAASAAAIY